MGSLWDHLQNKSDPKLALFAVYFHAILKNVDSERRWPTRWKLHYRDFAEVPKIFRLKYRRFSGVPFMPVVKSIVSKNELHAVQNEVIPVASGVTIDHIMSAQSQELDIIEKLRMLDLQPTAFLLTHPKKGIRWGREKTVEAIAHYKMFLLLHYLYPDKNLVPTEEIDLVWEHHFADSAKYRQDSQILFNSYLDHNPYFGILDETDEKNWLAAFAETKLLFEKHFGKDFLAAVNLQFTNPARCELPKKQKQIHPLNIQADVIDILP
jgi:hypothetical protein